MRAKNCWLVVVGLLVALTLICASAQGVVGLPLPLAMLIGLGGNALIVVWQNREKLSDILGTRSR